MNASSHRRRRRRLCRGHGGRAAEVHTGACSEPVWPRVMTSDRPVINANSCGNRHQLNYIHLSCMLWIAKWSAAAAVVQWFALHACVGSFRRHPCWAYCLAWIDPASHPGTAATGSSFHCDPTEEEQWQTLIVRVFYTGCAKSICENRRPPLWTSSAPPCWQNESWLYSSCWTGEVCSQKSSFKWTTFTLEQIMGNDFVMMALRRQ